LRHRYTPVLDALANRVVQKNQSSTCQQLMLQKAPATAAS
jgi:hypothetical protein